MSDPADLLQWHEDRIIPERRDESFLAQDRKLSIVEKRPVSNNPAATEILDFLGEYCSGFKYKSACSMLPARFVIKCAYMDDTSGKTLRDAVCLAAAKFEEANE